MIPRDCEWTATKWDDNKYNPIPILIAPRQIQFNPITFLVCGTYNYNQTEQPIHPIYLVYSGHHHHLARYLPQHVLPKSNRTSCTIYGSSRFTYHHGTRCAFVSEHVSGA